MHLLDLDGDKEADATTSCVPLLDPEMSIRGRLGQGRVFLGEQLLSSSYNCSKVSTAPDSERSLPLWVLTETLP